MLRLLQGVLHILAEDCGGVKGGGGEEGLKDGGTKGEVLVQGRKLGRQARWAMGGKEGGRDAEAIWSMRNVSPMTIQLGVSGGGLYIDSWPQVRV